MDRVTKDAILEAAKEAGRLILFAIPGIVIQVVSQNPTFSSTLIGGLILLVLRMIDKYIHENPKIEAKGLTPF